ncbi:hypothetical protein DASC09_029210 [Saccharomycopsis crataegensis]|uniref:Ketopantoate reductase C-terminal domain-containing protein n=1 Tax=Saccharomycopsis crataegensis TaxID=43959 RepID=A0AAV5QLZ6_9ASCO|nr:hypothetical protein DASC09_029210 [Saccharomycopsis crataegensis]
MAIPRTSGLDDSSINTFIAWRLSKVGVSVILLTNNESPINWISQTFGSESYSPHLTVKSVDQLMSAWDTENKLDYLLLYSPSLIELKSLVTEIKPLVGESSTIIVNSNFSIHLEPVVYSALPNSNVFSLYSSLGIKKVQDYLVMTRESNLSIFLGLSIHHNDQMVPQSSIAVLNSKKVRSPLGKFIALLKKSGVKSVFKVSTVSRTRFATLLWKRLIHLICFDCFAALFRIVDMKKLFTDPLVSPLIQNIMNEILVLAYKCGNKDLKPSHKDAIFKKMMDEFTEESDAPMEHYTIVLPPFIKYSLVLFNYYSGQGVPTDLILVQLIMLSMSLRTSVPTIQFLYASLVSQLKYTGVALSTVKNSIVNSPSVQTVTHTIDEPMTPNQSNDDTRTSNNEIHYSQRKALQSATSGIDSGIEDFYISDSSLFFEATEKIDSLVSDEQGVNDVIEESVQDPDDSSILRALPFSNTLQTDDESADRLRMVNEAFSEVPVMQIIAAQSGRMRDVRFHGDVEEELPETNINVTGDYTRSSTAAHGFTNTIGNSSQSKYNISNSRYGDPNKSYKFSRNKDSHVLFKDYKDLIDSLHSSGFIDDTNGRYGVYDSFSSSLKK